MFLISAEKFSLWKKKQISKGGDNHSLNLLIDSLGGLSEPFFLLLTIGSIVLYLNKRMSLTYVSFAILALGA